MKQERNDFEEDDPEIYRKRRLALLPYELRMKLINSPIEEINQVHDLMYIYSSLNIPTNYKND